MYKLWKRTPAHQPVLSVLRGQAEQDRIPGGGA